MRLPVIIAITGGILFAVGLLGTIVTSAAARNLDPDYVIDCLGVAPAANCPARLAAIQGAQATVLAFEIIGILGVILIVAAAVMDVIRRRSKSPPSA